MAQLSFNFLDLYVTGPDVVALRNHKVLKIKRQANIVNASYLFTQISYIVKTYTTTAREPSIYVWLKFKTIIKKENILETGLVLMIKI